MHKEKNERVAAKNTVTDSVAAKGLEELLELMEITEDQASTKSIRGSVRKNSDDYDPTNGAFATDRPDQEPRTAFQLMVEGIKERNPSIEDSAEKQDNCQSLIQQSFVQKRIVIDQKRRKHSLEVPHVNRRQFSVPADKEEPPSSFQHSEVAALKKAVTENVQNSIELNIMFVGPKKKSRQWLLDSFFRNVGSK